jgi:hypothetical protein
MSSHLESHVQDTAELNANFTTAPTQPTPPSWYTITEIPFGDYVECLASIYAVLEGREGHSDDDPFMKRVLMNHSGMTTELWEAAKKQRMFEKALTMKMGDFHEELAGKFRGYRCLAVGDATGCDVQSLDGTHVMEWKNRDNTMNSSSASAVIAKLKAVADSGKKATLVLVNSFRATVPRFGAPASVEVIDGRTAYAQLSGRPDFIDSLEATMGETFARYKTYAELENLV